MITKENFSKVVSMIDNKDKKRIRNSDKEYVVLYLHMVNSGAWVTIKLTNDYNKYENVSNDGNCILELEDVISRI